MQNIVENYAYLTHANGTKIQVLLADGSDWDELATSLAFAEYEASL